MTTSTPKQIILNIPQEKEVPNEWFGLSPEECYLILTFGCELVRNCKQSLTAFAQKVIYDDLQKEFSEKIRKLELEITIEKEMAQRHKEEERKMLEREIDKALKYKIEVYEKLCASKDVELKHMSELWMTREREMVALKEAVLTKELEMNQIINNNVNERLRMEQEKQSEKMRDVLVKNNDILENIKTVIAAPAQTKSSVAIGTIGEKLFGELAEKAFANFDGFELMDVHKQKQKGDWHLVFKEFTIMVDAKMYKRKVDSTQREKIKNDLRKNEHIHFAWLVSLNTKIDKYDHAAFCFDWISNTQCVVYVNHLFENTDNIQMDMLKTMYYLCRDHYHRLIIGENDQIEISKLRETHFRLKDKIQMLRNRTKEIKASINALKNLHDGLEKDILNLLNEETNTAIHKYYDKVVDWWGGNIVACEDGKLKSTNVWMKFKRENGELVKDMTSDEFKDIICAYVPEHNIVKSKSKSGAIEICGVQWLVPGAENENGE